MTASVHLAELEEAVRELLAALGPCGDIDKKGNCRNHFATCPCEVEEVKRLMDKRLESNWAKCTCGIVWPTKYCPHCGRLANTKGEEPL